LSEAQREAISQKVPIKFRYDNINKIIVIYDGNYGALSDARNRIIDFSSFGLEKSYIVYGRPDEMINSPLADASNLTELTENSVEISFLPDGSVRDASDNLQNNALFFYYKKHPEDSAFAVSVQGEGGHIKVWGYSKNINDYVEKKQ
jgi:hypothetical protein